MPAFAQKPDRDAYMEIRRAMRFAAQHADAVPAKAGMSPFQQPTRRIFPFVVLMPLNSPRKAAQ